VGWRCEITYILHEDFIFIVTDKWKTTMADNERNFKLSKRDANEAPEGFYAVLKDNFKIPNACDACDARKLCQDNTDEWCLKNRCMSYEIIAFKDGKTYSRNDKQSVLFKRKV